MSNLTALLNKYKALVIFDTETSGLDFDKDQIIELAALRVERTASGGLRIAGKMDTFIKLPEGETLPENIVSLTGITDTLLQTEGVQPAKAASQIAKLMQPGPVLMIAHNAQFDACFLRGLLRGAKVGRIDWLDSLTVYNARTDNVILYIEGYIDVSNNTSSELVVTCKVGPTEYKKNYVYLNDYTLYVVEDINGTHTDPYHYKVYFHTDVLPSVEVRP